MELIEQIEDGLKQLKTAKHSDDKSVLYGLTASRITRYLKQTKIKQFNRGLILSFFPSGYFPTTTTNRHIKAIIQTLKQRGIIDDEQLNKTTLQRRVYELKSRDFESYFALMKNNGFNIVEYFVFYQDKNGIPRRRKVGQSKINGLPVDKNGLPVDKYDISVLKQTIPRRKQGVYSYGNKSIANEKRVYSVKGYKVLI